MLNGVVFLLEQAAIGLYIFIGVGMFLMWLGWGRQQRRLRATRYELERGMARHERANAITGFILLAEAALVVLGVQRVVAPTLRQQSDVAAARLVAQEDGSFITPTPFVGAVGQALEDAAELTVQPQLEATLPEQAILATPTLTPTPVGTIIPNSPDPLGCDTPNATLQIPANGMVVFEPLEVTGTAFTTDFAFYRFELRGESTFNEFAILQEAAQRVEENGVLGQFVPAFYQPGEYEFRLTVFDTTNQLRASCTYTIYISDPIPTPTPIGAGA